MKKLFTCFALYLIGFNAMGQFSSSFNYSLGLPQGRMAKNINAVHQMVFNAGMRLPHSFNFMTVGAEIGLGTYANLRVPTTFSFNNGSPTTLDVNYESNTFNANATVNVDLIRHFAITPYVTLKGGVHNFNSQIQIDDPRDADGCRPLESKSIMKDNTMAFSYGGGLRIEIGKNNSWGRAKKQFINVQVLQTRGGYIDYINTKKLEDAQTHNHTSTPDPDGDGAYRPLEMKFINVQSNIVHDHKIAEVYSTPLRLLDIKVGYFVEF